MVKDRAFILLSNPVKAGTAATGKVRPLLSSAAFSKKAHNAGN